MIIENFKQGSEEWLSARCGVVTASNFSRVLAKGSGKTRAAYLRQLVEEAISGTPYNGYENEYMLRGTALEPQARGAYEKFSRNCVREVGLVYLDSNRRVSASPDGLIEENGGLEIKCPIPKTHCVYLKGSTAPSKYRAQIQGNLWITGRKWWDFVSYTPEMPTGERMIIHRVERDDVYIEMLQNEILGFVHDMDKILEESEMKTPMRGVLKIV